MKLSRRSFFGVLASAACSVLGAVYGVSADDGDREYPYWKSEVKQGKWVTQEELEAVFERQYRMMIEQPRSNFVLT